jgi:hypothetical protein
LSLHGSLAAVRALHPRKYREAAVPAPFQAARAPPPRVALELPRTVEPAPEGRPEAPRRAWQVRRAAVLRAARELEGARAPLAARVALRTPGKVGVARERAAIPAQPQVAQVQALAPVEHRLPEALRA